MTLTRDEILKIPAGREMDALIAKHIFNHRVFMTFKEWERAGRPLYNQSGDNDVFVGDIGGNLPKFSSDISAAWEVVEKICIEAPEDCWTGPQMQINYSHEECEVIFTNLDSIDCISETAEATAKTAPLAICRAALVAVQSASPTHDLP